MYVYAFVGLVIISFLDKNYTLAIALPGSILNNAQGPELRTYLAGQIARTCAIFCVDEVVIFDETARMTKKLVFYSHALLLIIHF